MKDSTRICQILMQQYNCYEIAKECGFGEWEQYGEYTYFRDSRVQVIIALYENQTWEKIAAFEGTMYKATDKKQPPRLGRILLNKTRQEALEIIDEYFEKYQINGKCLIKIES